MKVGDGLEEGVDVGPLISRAACERVRGYVDRAEAEGAEIVLDGRDAPEGFVGPTIVDGVTPEMEVWRDEVFGPVLAMVHAESLDDAIGIVNSSAYGNGVSIFTESGAAVRRFRHDVEVGMIGVNVGVAAPGRVLPVLGLEGLLPRRPARPRAGRGRVLHAQEDRHEPLVLGWRDGALFRRVLSV